MPKARHVMSFGHLWQYEGIFEPLVTSNLRYRLIVGRRSEIGFQTYVIWQRVYDVRSHVMSGHFSFRILVLTRSVFIGNFVPMSST